MKPILIIQPMVALMLWTIVIWTYMYIRRLTIMHRMKIDPQSVAQGMTDPRKSPPGLANPSNNLRNLFEIPVIFYAVALTLSITSFSSIDVQLAWSFVIMRVLHSLIHVSYNRVIHRFVAYAVGALILWVMVVRLALQVFS